MSTTTATSLGALAKNIAPVLTAHRAEAKRQARMVPEVLAALRDASLFRLCAPVECGGHEADLRTAFDVMEALAKADPGAAWHVANAVVAGACAACVEPSQRALLFGEPSGHFGFSAVPGGTARQVEGGWVLDGHWPFVTGSLDAIWMGLTARIVEADGRLRLGANDLAVARTFFVRAGDATVEPTWGWRRRYAHERQQRRPRRARPVTGRAVLQLLGPTAAPAAAPVPASALSAVLGRDDRHRVRHLGCRGRQRSRHGGRETLLHRRLADRRSRRLNTSDEGK